MTGDCTACVEEATGLCDACAAHDKSILPQLKQPSYVKLIGTSQPRLAAPGSAPLDIPALGTPGRRLARALAGHFTRVARLA